MKAMILAAGLGSRLGALTKTTPKSLMKIGEREILEIIIEKLKIVGVSEIIINLHHLGEVIEEYVKAKKFFGIKITFAKEGELLGTGGGLENVKNFFDTNEPFILHNCDIYSDININDMLSYHQEQNSQVTLAVMKRSSKSHLLFDSQNNLCGLENANSNLFENFGNEADYTPYGFCCISIINSEFFKYLKFKKPYSIITSYLEAAKTRETVKAFIVENDVYWIDIGQPERLKEAQDILAHIQTLN